MKSKSKYLGQTNKFQETALLWLCRNFIYVFAFKGQSYKQGFDTIFYASNKTLPIYKLDDLKSISPNPNICLSLSYDLKNQIEKLESKHNSFFDFREIIAIEAEIRLVFKNNRLTLFSNFKSPDRLIKEIENFKSNPKCLEKTKFKEQTSKDEYLQKVSKIKEHISEGDIYEMCYCIEFVTKNYILDSPAKLFNDLCKTSPKPFSSFLKQESNYVIGASPERFIKRNKNKIISQPIKGTIKRVSDQLEDTRLKNELALSEKDRAENLMIVDLVRNDLSKICESNSVMVRDLFGVYSFPELHQMISTVEATLKPNYSFYDIIRALFPMGSMTGAPKIKAMELIETYENFRRGLYSGTMGYFTEDGFDFNVVIRSLQYNEDKKILAFHVGSAITYESDSEKEYAECLLKAEALLGLFTY